jgi:hypothetical protein
MMPLQRGNTRSGTSVDAVVLAIAASGQPPVPCGGCRAHVHDVSAPGEQPRRVVCCLSGPSDPSKTGVRSERPFAAHLRNFASHDLVGTPCAP